jgi:acyl-CoA thioesterase-1
MKFLLFFALFPAFLNAETMQNQILVCLGDSITAGYGLPLAQAYPALIQQKIDALKWPVTVVNAGLSGDTTAAGEQRLHWVLRQKVDILVIALGGNDGLRGVAPEVTKANLQRMIDYARKKQPDIEIVLAGMKMPPNLGRDFTGRFETVFVDLARTNKVRLVPFLLEGVGGVADLNQADRIHPTAKGQERIAETLWVTLRPLLARRF